MADGFDVTVAYDGNNVDAHMWAEGVGEERPMGFEVHWTVEIDEEGETKEVLTFSEYPENSFTEVERDPLLTTSLGYFTGIILDSRNPDE